MNERLKSIVDLEKYPIYDLNSSIIKSLIKKTIFEQFCGGESIEDCNKRILELSKFNIQNGNKYWLSWSEKNVHVLIEE